MAFDIQDGVLVKYTPEDGETEVTVPDGVTEIGKFVFFGCKSMKKLTIPDCVAKIGNEAFAWCTEMTELILPGKALEIDRDAFVRCDGLRTVRFGDLGTVQLPETLYGLRRAAGLAALITGESYSGFASGAKLCYMLERYTFLRDKESEECLSRNLPFALRALLECIIEAEKIRALEYLLTHPEWISKRGLSAGVQTAIRHTAEGGSIEPQVMLMDYYNTHYGAEDAENITL